MIPIRLSIVRFKLWLLFSCLVAFFAAFGASMSCIMVRMVLSAEIESQKVRAVLTKAVSEQEKLSRLAAECQRGIGGER